MTAPVIIVTARDEIEDRALGLDLGADDYLTKPFYMVEPRVRIQASIRRYYGKSSPVLSVGRLTVTPLSLIHIFFRVVLFYPTGHPEVKIEKSLC